MALQGSPTVLGGSQSFHGNENHYHLQEKIQLIEKPYKLSAKNIQANKSIGLYLARQVVPGSRVTEA